MATRSPGRFPALLLLAGALATPASAFVVTPMVVRLAPSGEGASAELAVRNGADRAVSLEISVDRRTVDPDGAEIREPADADFQLSPVQMAVPASGTQQVRLTYVGNPALAAAQAYAVNVRQLPVDLHEDSTGVTVLLTMVAFAEVVPPGAVPALDVAASATSGGLSLEIRNSGTAQARLGSYRLQLTSGDMVRTLEPEHWLDPDVSSWLLPGGRRRIEVQPSAALELPPGRSWSAKLLATGDAG